MTCFTYGQHREYEQMMKRMPFQIYSDEYDRFVSLHYTNYFYEFLKEYNLERLKKRIENAKKNMLFDDFLFLNENHRNIFYKSYNRYLKRHRADDNKIAVMYLLSASDCFYPILTELILKNKISLSQENTSSLDMFSYIMYHAAKMLVHEDSGLKYKDLFDRNALEDEMVCLILNAMFITHYGTNCCIECGPKKKKQGYIKNSKNAANTVYFYGSSLVRVG